ncbi:MAG TPA: GAF domain-containing protein, partial [Ktedonobacterales bacterium]
AYRGLLAMPIIFFPEPHLIGVISVQSERPRRFSDEEAGFLEILTGQLSLSILNGRLFIDSVERGRRQLMDLRTLERISAQVASSLDRESVAHAIVEQAVLLSGADAAVLLERDDTIGELRPLASHALDDMTVSARSLAQATCCAVRAANTGKPVTGHQCDHRDGTCIIQAREGAADDLRVAHCQPLATMIGPIGALCVFTRDARGLDARALMLIGTFANVAAIAMENARLFARVTRELETQVALRRELEHRINNSLTALRHLIRNRRQRATTQEAQELFSELISQVEGLIEINRLLSRSDEIGAKGVQAGDLVRTIVDIIKRQLIPAELKVSFTIGKIPGVMAFEPATVFGIVINELVANALEHGFEGRQRGTIRIHGIQTGDRVKVRVADNGAGLPEGFTVTGQASTGLTLVRQLVQSDLHGSIAIYCISGDPADFQVSDALSPGGEQWTVAELEFPAELRGVERHSHLGIGKTTI